MSWIKISEEKPPKGEDVILRLGGMCVEGYLTEEMIVSMKKGFVTKKREKFNFIDCGCCCSEDSEPTHWMKIPELPEDL